MNSVSARQFIILTLLSVSSVSIAGGPSKECLENEMFGHFYRQKKYAIKNHQEDLILASLGNRYAETLLDKLKLKKLDAEKRQSQERWIKKNCSPHVKSMAFGSEDLEDLGKYLTPRESKKLEECRYKQDFEKFQEFDCEVGKIVRKSPVQVKAYVNNFDKVIQEHQKKYKQVVYRSRPHTWSVKTKKERKELRKKFPASAIMPKLLATLAMGATARFMATENDKNLRRWILQQPMSSLRPEDLFKKSLQLQKGDIYKALLSIENVLSEYWLAPNRQHLRQTSSLRSITNYCPGTPMVDGDYGGSRKHLKSDDVFGSWYHLFGTMLLGCVEGPILSTIVGKTESLGGRVLDIKKAKKQGHNIAAHMIVGSDPQEEKINARGGRIGHGICKNTPRNYFKNLELENPKVIDFGAIFNKKKKFYDRLYDCEKEGGCFICETRKCMKTSLVKK